MTGWALWAEVIALVGFLLVNFSAVFVAFFWGLGEDEQQQKWVKVEDRGEMSEGGVPYVPGSDASRR